MFMKNHQRILSKYSRWKIDENLICFNHHRLPIHKHRNTEFMGKINFSICALEINEYNANTYFLIYESICFLIKLHFHVDCKRTSTNKSNIFTNHIVMIYINYIIYDMLHTKVTLFAEFCLLKLCFFLLLISPSKIKKNGL